MTSIDKKRFDENTIGIISRDGIFYIKDKKEIDKIHKSFYIFCLNRFNNLATCKSVRYYSEGARVVRNKGTFMPRINNKSRVIDEKRNAVSSDPRYKILLRAGKRYQENKRTKSKEKQESEDKKYTYKPKVHSGSFRSHIKKSDIRNDALSNRSEEVAFEETISQVTSKDENHKTSSRLKKYNRSKYSTGNDSLSRKKK